MSAATEAGAVLYHEPSIVTILVQSSFILALNIIDYVLDRAIYCGLVGQILIGMAWGTPGADILGSDFQGTITNLGYLGLILLVFEGGLSTDMKALRSNIVLSSLVAFTGITLPIALSFILMKMCHATTLQSFAAGCALSSTSLGTTLAVLKSNGLDKTRLGTVLTSAAMLDDVVGLVLVQVISNLGSLDGGTFSAITIVRPVLVSIGYAALIPILLYLFNALGPRIHVNSWASRKVATVLAPDQVRIVYYTSLLIAAVASSSYAGTSNLFAAYLAGLVISSGRDYKSGWHEDKKVSVNNPATDDTSTQDANTPEIPVFDNTNDSWEMLAMDTNTPGRNDFILEAPTRAITQAQAESRKLSSSSETGTANASTRTTSTNNTKIDTKVYEKYYATIVNKLLKGFFFGSIGFSIPITRLFDGPTLWRGIVFSILMTLGKLSCGIWLVHFSPPTPSSTPTSSNPGVRNLWTTLLQHRPQSLYPAGILGNAMVARGEIGFLISAIAQSNGIFDVASEGTRAGQGDLLLIVTWAILICTIAGPVSVGLLTRRVKRLRKEAGGVREGRVDPLGIWADL